MLMPSNLTQLLLNKFQRYKSEGHDTIILAGAEYGSGSSRDWAAKGPMLLVCPLTVPHSINSNISLTCCMK